MSHFAKVENGIVTRVIVAEQPFINTLDGNWVQTSYNTYGGVHKLGGIPMRKNFAGVGYYYNSKVDAFFAPQPYLFWTLDPTTFLWEPPVPYPTDGKIYEWDEETINWKEIK